MKKIKRKLNLWISFKINSKKLNKSLRKDELNIKIYLYKFYIKNHGHGRTNRAAHPAIHVPSPALQAIITAGTPAPPVTVPKVNPAAV